MLPRQRRRREQDMDDDAPRMLVLGGSGLLGSAITAAAAARGWHVTSVHRGRSVLRGAGAAPEGAAGTVEQLTFAREDGHVALADMRFDAVIDNSGFVPAVVRDAIDTLRGCAGHWTYISSISAHADHARPMQGAVAALLELPDEVDGRDPWTDPHLDVWSTGTYGSCKAACEQVMGEELAGAATVIRPVVVAGLHDSTFRFDYWVDRFLDGGDIVAPEPQLEPVAVVDARDIAEFVVTASERRTPGTFIAAPDPAQATFHAMMSGCEAAARELGAPPASVHWTDPAVLQDACVEPWAALPFWLPESTGSRGMNSLDTSASRAAGFTTRPLVETARWVAPAVRAKREAGELDVPEARLTRELEAELVAAVV